jgi:hypothetical protein
MKIASTANPNGYSGIDAAEVTMRGSKLSGIPIMTTMTQYEPGLSEEVGILWMKLPLLSVATFVVQM